MPHLAKMLAENLAIKETTQSEITQDELMQAPEDIRNLGIWNTKRDPGNVFDSLKCTVVDTDIESQICGSNVPNGRA